ncbi:MAG: M28 family peptidase [Planctomycetes bacterium]|nr:M28 family peptidase [Planctomycetota bacterium]
MRNVYKLLFVVFLSTAGYSYDDKGTTTAEEKETVVKNTLEFATAKFVEETVTYLASDELEGRFSGSEGERKATEFIADTFRNAGLLPIGDTNEFGEKTYFQKFSLGMGKLSIRGRNCIGLLEGTDPQLKNEYILVGAHHDHVGNPRDNPTHAGMLEKPKKNDDIFNGADDNASGTSTLVTIVNAIGRGSLKFKRSIIFMTFSAEELGLIGSNWYTKKPCIPLENHIAMINMDMLGGNKGQGVGISGLDTDKSGLLKSIAQKCVDKIGLKAGLSGGTHGGSDHASFFPKKIPIMSFETGLHDRYHRTSDHAEFLDFERMAKTAKCVILILSELGDGSEKPEMNLEFLKARSQQGKMLGVYPVDLEKDALEELGLEDGQGALEIQQVVEDSVAEKYGIEPGDYIIKFNGKTFKPGKGQQELTTFIRKVPYDTPIPIEIIRSGEKITIEVVWEEEQEPKLFGINSTSDFDEEERSKLSLSEDETAVIITSVNPDSVAEKCGIQEGDYLVSFNNEKLPKNDPLNGLKKLIQSAKYNEKIPVEIIRNGKRKTLNAFWEMKKKKKKL